MAPALLGPHGMWFWLSSFHRKEGFRFHTNQGGRGGVETHRTHSRWELVFPQYSLPDAGCPSLSPRSEGRDQPLPGVSGHLRALLSSWPPSQGQCLSRACAGSAEELRGPRCPLAWSRSFLGHSRCHCSLSLQPWSKTGILDQSQDWGKRPNSFAHPSFRSLGFPRP